MVKSNDILNALRDTYSEDEWLFAGEVRLLGFQHEQRLDAFAIALWPSKKGLRHSYEIKVSRGDFLNEIKNPQKRQFALNNSEYFWFAIKEGIADKSEIPEEAGLIIYQENGKLKKIKKAPKRKVEPVSIEMMLAVGKRMRTEAKRKFAEEKEIPGYKEVGNIIEHLSVICPSENHLKNEEYRLLSSLRKSGHMKEALYIEKSLAKSKDIIDRNIEKRRKILWGV